MGYYDTAIVIQDGAETYTSVIVWLLVHLPQTLSGFYLLLQWCGSVYRLAKNGSVLHDINLVCA